MVDLINSEGYILLIENLRGKIDQLERENADLKTLCSGKSNRSYLFTKDENNWYVKVIILDHKGANPKNELHTIPRENVRVVWRLIKSLNKSKTNKAELGELLIKEYNLPYKDHKELSGNRGDYFEKFYYPVTILDYLKYVEYKRTIKILK